MRWLILAVVVSLGFAVWVGVSALSSGPPQSPDAYEPHLPETDEEKHVARVATEYVRWLIRRKEVFEREPLEIETMGVREDETASVSFIGLEPGPGYAVHLRRDDGKWRVTSHYGYGLASAASAARAFST